MYETYPKGSAHPSRKVGEQDGEQNWEGKNRTSYPNTTVSDTNYEGDRVHTRSSEGGSGSPNGPDYAKSRVKFDTEKHVGK